MTSVPSIAQAFDPHSKFANSSAFATTYTNPPFDPRRYSTNPWYAGVQQGLLLRKGFGASGGTLGKSTSVVNPQNSQVLDSVKLRFLYNPSDFSESLTPSDTLFPNITGATGSTDPNDTASLIGQTTTTCSFNLLFDRTYELNQSFNTAGDPNSFSHKTGVYVDILAFKVLLGIPKDGNGMALFLPVRLILGGVNSPTFYGVITSASIAYSHFSVNMVPLRAAISISMTQWLDDTGSTAGTSSAGSANTAAIAERLLGSGDANTAAIAERNITIKPRAGTIPTPTPVRG